jgi:hypothetical protein
VASASESPPLALDRYATLQAEIEAGNAQDAVLTQAEVPTERWLAAHAYWLKRMAEEAERKRFETTIRYQTVYSIKRKLFENRAAREREKAGRPPVAAPPVAVMSMMSQALAQPIGVQVPATAFPSPPPIERTRAPEPNSGLPSFLRQGARPAAAPAPAVHAPPPVTTGTGTLPAPPPAIAVAPAKPEFVAIHQATDAEAEGLARRRRANMTMNIDRADLEAAAAKSATPFIKRPSESAMPAVTEPPRFEPGTAPPPSEAKHPGQTQLGSLEAERASMPFTAGATKPGQTAPGGSHAGPPSTPFRVVDEPQSDGGGSGTAPMPEDARRMAQDLYKAMDKARPGYNPAFGRTGTVDPEVMRRAQEAMPFRSQEGGARPPSSASFAAVRPAPTTDAPSSGRHESPKTQAFDFNSIPAHLKEALPFAGQLGGSAQQAAPQQAAPQQAAPQQAAPQQSSAQQAQVHSTTSPTPPSTPEAAPHKKRFTINVFASLTAEIAEAPHEVEAIRARYGVSESEHHEESMRWTTEFQSNDDVRQRYLGIVQRYRGYIRQRIR